MQADGLLALLDGAVVAAFAQLHALLVADHVEGDELGIVVFIAFLFLQIAVDEGLRTVEVDIVSGGKRVIHAVCGRVLLHVAARQEDERGEK